MKMGTTNDSRTDLRLAEIEPFETKVWLSSPTMHGEEQKCVDEAIRTNWVSTVGANMLETENRNFDCNKCTRMVV